MATDKAWYQARIDKAKLQVEAIEDALTFLAANPTMSYSLDTGQGVQKVTRFEMASLQRQIDVLLNRIEVLNTKITGCGVLNVGPGW